VVIPAYNEENTIRQAIDSVRSVKDDLRREGVELSVCVIDDGSVDSTYARAIEADVEHLEHHKLNSGLGAAVRSGFAVARRCKFDLLVKIDADLQHDPNDILNLIRPIINDEADVVYGNRFEKIEYKMPFVRRWGNRVFRGLMNFLTGWSIKDSQPGIFAVGRDYINVYHLPGDYNYTQQILLDASCKGMRFAQVPVAFRKREHGQSFVTLKYPFKVLPQLLIVLISVKPIRFFFPVGFLFLAIGSAIFFVEFLGWIFGAYPKPVVHTNFVLGTLLFGSQWIFFGLLSELVVRMNKNIFDMLSRKE